MLSTCMRYPIVKLAKLSNEDQQQIMESLSKFAENKPKLAKELGIVPEIVKDENVKMEDVKKKDENWYVWIDLFRFYYTVEGIKIIDSAIIVTLIFQKNRTI